MKVLVSIGFLLIVALSGAFAELLFSSKKVTKEVGPSDETFTATFTFENTGKRAVEISKVDSNCGCLRAEADKKVYAKGESGEITAEFSLGSAEGVQTKQIWVVYAEVQPVEKPKVLGRDDLPNEAPQEAVPPIVPGATERLTVEVTVPTLISIEPKISKWELGSPPEARKVKLVVHHDEPIHISEVRSSRENITVATNEITAGKEYELILTPKSTAELQLGSITILTDCKLSKHVKKLAFFAIERPSAKPDHAPAPQPASESNISEDANSLSTSDPDESSS